MRLIRFIAATCFAVLTTSVAAAQPVSQSYEPAVGVTWEIAETRTRTRQVGTAPATPNSGSITATLKVTGKSNDGYDMEWTTTLVTAGGSVVDGILPELFIGVPIRFHTNTEGIPAVIVDSSALLETMLATIHGKFGTAETAKATASTSALFTKTPPLTLARVLLPEATAIGSCHNLELEPGRTYSATSPVTALGGKTVDAIATARMETRGSASEPAHIRLTQEIGQGAMSGAINGVVEEAGRKTNAQEQQVLDSITRMTVTDCTLDPVRGEATSVIVDMKVSASGMHLIDRREITMKRLN